MSAAPNPSSLQQRLEQLEAENQSLRGQLEDAQQTLTAIREGQVDALVINTPDGERVFSLQGAERPYRALIEQMQEGAAILTLDGTIHYCNQAFARMLGRPMETVVGSPLEQHIGAPDRAAYQTMLRQARGCSAHGEVGLNAAKDRIIPVNLGLTLLVNDGDGSLCAVATDLTERKHQEAKIIQLNQELEQRVTLRTAELQTANLELASEAALRRRVAATAEQQRQLLAVTLASIGDAVISTDAQGRVAFLNAEAERLTGWRGADAQGRPLPTVFNIVNEETHQAVENPVDKVLRLGTVVGLANHTMLIAKDGTETPIDDSAALIRQHDGTSYGVVLVFRDFSQQKAAQKALRESEGRFRALADAMPQLAWTANADGYVNWYNRRWYEYTGTTPQRMEGWGWQSVHDPKILPTVVARWKAALASGTPVEMDFPIRGADGRFRHFLTRVMPLKDADGRVVQWFATSTDVEDMDLAAKALRQSQERFRSVLDNSVDCIYRLNTQTGLFEYISPAAQKISGFTPDELMAQDAQTGLALVHPDDLPAFQAAMARLEETGQARAEYRQRTKSGEYRWFSNNLNIVRESSGRPLYRDGSIRDVTESKQAEEDLLAAKLSAEQAKAAAEQASKAKDNFLAVLSHELRNPLNPVLATATMLRNNPNFDTDTREQLEVICRNAEMEARLIDDLLDVTRIERGKIELDRRPVDLLAIIHSATEVCLRDIRARKLEFGIDAPDGPYWLDADAGRMQQVFWNLIKNAIKFTPAGGCLGVRCRRVGDAVVTVEVNDSGEGMEPADLGRIFNAFEQTSRNITRQFGGLGLGLTISKGLVEMHGGSIRAESAGKGKGATFTVRLPLIPAPMGALKTDSTSAASPAALAVRPLRILLVEDHADTARIMRKLLSVKGHAVQIAADVAGAIALAEKQSFDLLLSDLGLPDGSGLDLMRALQARGIHLPGIALSGYGQESDLVQTRAAGFAVHLVKPISLPKLEEAIAKLTGAG